MALSDADVHKQVSGLLSNQLTIPYQELIFMFFDIFGHDSSNFFVVHPAAHKPYV